MKELPKVSVAVVTYNQEGFIRDTLDSIIIQDYPNLEIVIADDASRDRTPDIAKEYAEKYPDMFKLILAEENLGIAENCNRAFFACSGKYIAWLGGDDLFYPNKLKLQVEAMESDEKCDLSFHAVRVFNSADDATIAITNGKDKRRRDLKQVLMDGISLPGSAVMVRRSSCPVDGFDISIPRANDWLFFMETMIHGYALRVEGVLGGYRIHNNNITNISLIDDMHKTFKRLRSLRPDLLRSISRAEAIACYREGRKVLAQRDIRTARKIFLAGIKVNYTYTPLWIWFAISLVGAKNFEILKSLYNSIKRAV